MNVIDLTHLISPNMTVYPGTEAPRFDVPCTIEKDGFTERKISLYSHTGTHIDAPSHIIQGGKTLNELSVEKFIGRAVVLDLSSINKHYIDVSDLEKFGDIIRGCDFVLLHTGWSKFWGSNEYFKGYPVLSINSAKWLSEFNIKGIGIDAISVDEAGTVDFPIHRIFLSNEIVIIENLNNLNEISEGEFTFSCFPLKIKDGDGSPVRAVGY